MRATTIRPSFSFVIYEFDDFSCAVFEPGGEMVAQSWDHPEHVFPAALLLRSRILENREQPIRAALNEPFLIAGGSLAVRIMPADPGGDALHLALASYHKWDFLVTWNCQHLANANKFGHIRRVNAILGFSCQRW